jgi:hypothetical protein
MACLKPLVHTRNQAEQASKPPTSLHVPRGAVRTGVLQSVSPSLHTASLVLCDRFLQPRWVGTDDLVHLLATLQEEKRRHRLNIVRCRHVRRLVHCTHAPDAPFNHASTAMAVFTQKGSLGEGGKPSILRKATLGFSSAIFWTCGHTILQGPHHAAVW